MFLLVFRPHQWPAWASHWENEAEFIDAYLNGAFSRSCNADPDGEMLDRLDRLDQCQADDERYALVFGHVGHDLHALTRLDSPEEVERYLCERDYCGHHNKAYGQVASAARDIGWIAEDDD